MEVLAPDISGLVDKSLIAMLPGIRPSLSSVNSILELKDFKSLPKLLVQSRALLRQIKSIRPKAKTTLRLASKLVANGYLSKEFAVDPLIRDYESVKQALVTVQKELSKLLRDAGRVLDRHYARSLDETVYSDSDYSHVDTTHTSLVGDIRFDRSVRYRDRRFVATIRYSYKIPEMSKQLAIVNAFLDRFGINLNPAIIWNAIPFSFLIDWVVGVGQWLDQFKVRAIEPVCVIHDYCWSARIVRFIDVSKTHGVGGFYGAVSTVNCVSVEEDCFIRVPIVPDIVRSITTSGLNLKEFSLGAALVYLNKI